MTRENIISRLAILAENNAPFWRSEPSKHAGDDLSHQEETIFFAIRALSLKPCKACFEKTNLPNRQTQYEKLMAEMTVEKFAVRCIYDYEYRRYGADDGSSHEFLEDAIKAEIDWLNSEVESEEI